MKINPLINQVHNYFDLKDDRYCNYRYQPKKLRNTAFEFLLNRPLDDIN